jgi:outer membrane protein insertion porin family
VRRAILFFALFLIGVLDATAFQESETEPIVWNVSFEGNEAYRSMVLREVISTTSPVFFQKRLRRVGAHRLNETELRRDVIRLERYYQRRGFSDVSVRYEIEDRRKESRKDVIFHIRERQPLQIVSSNIVLNADEQVINEIESSRDYQRAVQRHEFREGQRYQFIRNADVEGRFLQLLENHGYAWPEVEINADVDSLTNRVEIEIQITPNSKTFFTEFIVEGELSVPERVLIRHTDIKKGTPYSRSIMQSAQRSIFNHHLFRFATITIPEQPKDSTLTALIRVREHLPRTIEASIGVGREEYVRGQVGWRHRNINGYGHRFGANIRASFIEQRASTDYLIPYTFNARSSNVTTLFGVHRLEPSYELLQAGFNSSLIYQIARNRTASLSYEYTFNEELSRDEGASLPDFAVSYNISSFNLSGYYSDGVSREPRGWVIQPSAEFSSTFNEADFRFQKFSLDVRRFTPISGTTTIAARIATGVIFYSQSDDLPFNIRYFTGGTNSVRGWNRRELGPSVPSFDEDGNFKTYVPIGGRSTFSFNLELRQQLNAIIPNFGMAFFLDGGQVWKDIESIDERPIQFGVGGGMRYQSPIGPVRVDIGYKLNPTDEDLNIFNGQNFGSARNRIGIHFSIGQAF